MRLTLTALTVHLIFAACNNPDNVKTITQDQTGQKIDSANTSRKFLIDRIKNLQQTITSNDKEKIAQIFQFPFSPSDFDIFIEESTFNRQLKLSGNKIDKGMFLQHFNEIKTNIWLEQVDSLFRHVKVDSLLIVDTLKYNDYEKSEPCYYSYELIIDKDYIRIRIDGNSNKRFKDENVSIDHVAENASEVCEHSRWWTLKLDGQKLVIENISGAG